MCFGVRVRQRWGPAHTWGVRDAQGAAGEYQLAGVAAGHRRVCRPHVRDENNGKEHEPERKCQGAFALCIFCHQTLAPALALPFVLFRRRRVLLYRPRAASSAHVL